MGAQSRRVGRPSKKTWRIELRLSADDKMAQALRREADERGVPIQQYITDLLTARYLHQQGLAFHEEQHPSPKKPESTDSASKLSNEWM